MSANTMINDTEIGQVCPECYHPAENGECTHCVSSAGSVKTDTEYAISLQRCIEAHCRDEVIREPLSSEAPHHAKKLNLYRANLVDKNEAMASALAEANETIRQLYELCPQLEGTVEEWLGEVLPFANK